MQPTERKLSEDLADWEAMLMGERKAFSRLYERYFQVLYNYGRKICHDGAQVEDSIHDLFVDLWRYKSNLASTSSVKFYLYRSLRRRIVKDQNQLTWFSNDIHLIQDALQLEIPSIENDIIESESKNQRINQLKRSLNDLAPRQYEALVLFYYDEFSYQEIASLLDVNEQSARNLVQRGLLRLRQYLKYIVSLFFFLSFYF